MVVEPLARAVGTGPGGAVSVAEHGHRHANVTYKSVRQHVGEHRSRNRLFEGAKPNWRQFQPRDIAVDLRQRRQPGAGVQSEAPLDALCKQFFDTLWRRNRSD